MNIFMHRRFYSIALILMLPAIIVLVAEMSGVWTRVGAHPWWSLSGALLGLGIGLACVASLAALSRFGRISPILEIVVFAVLALVACILMLNGKETFATSYASDAVSGRFWHFGYIGMIAMLYGALVSAGKAWLSRI